MKTMETEFPGILLRVTPNAETVKVWLLKQPALWMEAHYLKPFV